MPPSLAVRPHSAYKSVCHEAGGLTLVARVNTVAFQGIEVLDIDVQVQLSGGIVAFNVVEGWCRDASEDIARRAVATAWKSGKPLSKVASEFFTRHTGEDAPSEIVDA